MSGVKIMSVKKIIVKQTRSGIRATKRQKATLDCLGLGKIGREVEHKVSESVVGMLEKVSHLVIVKPV